MRRHLPILDESILDRIDIETPCTADWERMRGDARSRFCGDCRQHVYDLSTMTRPEAVALISRHDGKVCVRLRRRPDGRVVSADCRERLRAARRRGLAPFVVALVLVGVTQLALRLFGLHMAWSWFGEETGRGRMMGAMAPIPDQHPRMGEAAIIQPASEPEPAPLPPPRVPERELMGKIASPRTIHKK